MDRPIVAKHEEEQTGAHLIMAGIVSAFSILLIMITLVMSWELWIIPLLVIGIIAIWSLHIGRLVSGGIYEYLCTGLVTIEFFYFGVHAACLFDVPIVVCVLLFMLALLDKKPLLYLVNTTYALVLLYHLLFLHTINIRMGGEEIVRLVLGIVGTIGAMTLSGAIIGRRREERKKMNEVAGELETARRQNADFLSNVSHELRTPINMVTGISEVTMEKQISPKIREVMQSIQMAGKRLAGQINDILDYTEIVGNTLVVTNENYMPSSVVNDVITMVDMMNQEHNLEMIFDLDTQIPAVLVGDAEKISRVLRILLQNAIKFTEEGGIYVHVGYRQEKYGVNLDITICDTGIGITPSQLTHIYEDFYQADSGRSRYAGGLGLGIPIARGLLHAMEGFIHYTSKENQGTQVHISIPQGVADFTPSMTVAGAKQICAVCYFREDKYSRNEVRQFYDNMILHMAEGLGIQAFRAYRFGDLEKLMNNNQPTHLFLAQEEYVENIPYFEELGKTVCVVLIADKKFAVQEKSRVILLQKPFFALPIVNLLNGVTHEKDAGNGIAAEHAFSCEGIHALVVDDEEMNLVVARGILGSYGIVVDTCQSGAAAVEKCMQNVYDLIFLDHMMPGMDGVETLKHIRALKEEVYQNLPIIALTANAISGAREMFKGEGFTEFVPKPIERPVLERALRKILPEQRIRYHEEQREYAEADGSGNMTRQEQDIQEISKSPDAAYESAAAVSTEPDGQESFIDRLRQAGINVEVGLDYCGGAEDFYLEMLKMYCEQSEEKRKEIIALYEGEEWTDYAIKVHALKSTSLTIGAEKLSAQAKALELAGKGGDIAFVRENHEKLLQAYDAVCRLVRENVPMEGGGQQS